MENNNDWYEKYQQYQMEQKERQIPVRKRKKGLSTAGLVSVILAVAILAGGIGSFATGMIMKKNSTDITAAALSATALSAGRNAGFSFTTASKDRKDNAAPAATPSAMTKPQIVEMAAPSVVGIDVTIPVSTSNSFGNFWPFGDSFGNFYGNDDKYEAPGAGSGVIISNDGYIVTCNHLVEDATSVKVTLSDDSSYDATVIGTDAKNDLAIIKISPDKELVPATLGDSDMLTVGEDVIAIGNHMGELRGTATAGIVSAMNRKIKVEGTEMVLLQHDAAVSPGSSGGGLFNANGTLIGIVNAKASSSQAEGLGFAIPVNSVKNAIEDIINYGYVKGRAYLGVATQNRSLQMDGGRRGYYGNESTGGCVQVYQVIEGSAAEKAGIKANDLIIKVGDDTIQNNDDLSAAIGRHNAGDTTTIVVIRDGKEMTLDVTFGEYAPEKSEIPVEQ